MNTRAMFDKAQKQKLSAIELLGHCIWALVAQSGRKPMKVGEIAAHVQLTAKIKPSTYQVRRLMESLTASDTVYRHEIGQNGVAKIIAYQGGENAVMTLASLVHVFCADDVLYNAIHTATWPVRSAAIDVSNSIYNFNQAADGVSHD